MPNTPNAPYCATYSACLDLLAALNGDDEIRLDLIPKLALLEADDERLDGLRPCRETGIIRRVWRS